jgi:hypothetical protein
VHDAHLVVDIITLLFAVGCAYLAARRELSARLSAIETSVAEIRGALKAKGLNL